MIIYKKPFVNQSKVVFLHKKKIKFVQLKYDIIQLKYEILEKKDLY